MRITIWDMDWYYSYSHIPNHKAMKISSYHKQNDDYINFVENKQDLQFAYDIMYIIRERKHTPFPPGRYVDKEDVKMIGEEFIFYDNVWETTPVIDMCRPDYNLYPTREKSPYANASVVQFLHKGKLLPKKQNYLNFADKHHKKTLVVDEGIWRLDKKIILEILKELKIRENIAFLKPIELNFLLRDEEIREKFIKLHYSSGTYFDFINDLGQDFESAKKIIDFLADFRERNRVGLKSIEFDTVYYDHWKEQENGIKELNRILKIMDYAKKKKVKVHFKAPYERDETPHWIFFDIIDLWTRYSFRESFIEIMLQSTARRHDIKWYEVLNNFKKWSTPRADLLVYLINEYPQIVFRYGGRKWGNTFTNIAKIDKKTIIRYNDYRLKDTNLKNIEKAIAESTAGG